MPIAPVVTDSRGSTRVAGLPRCHRRVVLGQGRHYGDGIACVKAIIRSMRYANLMGIRKTTYELFCALTPRDVLRRVAQLLTDEGVVYTICDLSIASTSTPFAVVALQSRMYTRKNWVGINPFVSISGVVVDSDNAYRGGSRVTIEVNRTRAVLWCFAYVAFGVVAAASLMPMPYWVIFLIGWSLVMWVVNVNFFGGYLIQSEIRNALRT